MLLIFLVCITRIAHEIEAKLVSNLEPNMLYAKSYQYFCIKRIPMLAGLKNSSLACKCVFYRPEHNAVAMELNFEGLEMRNKIN